MVVSQHADINFRDWHLAAGLDLTDSSRRTEVINATVGPREADERDDLFVVNAFVAIARRLLVLDVSLAGYGADLQIGRHESLRWVSKTFYRRDAENAEENQRIQFFSSFPLRTLRLCG